MQTDNPISVLYHQGKKIVKEALSDSNGELETNNYAIDDFVSFTEEFSSKNKEQLEKLPTTDYFAGYNQGYADGMKAADKKGK